MSEVGDSESRDESQLEDADAVGSDGLSSYDVGIAGVMLGDLGISASGYNWEYIRIWSSIVDL